MKSIAVLSTTRAEYGLLYPLLKRLENDEEFQVDFIVSGTHLLEKYGKTIKYIEKDGINIAYQVPIYNENFVSTEMEAIQSIARGLKLFSEIFEKKRYEAVLVLGDRYELLSFCVAAMLFRIPIIHLHGGEITEGAIDDKIRHSITKMASIHFPSLVCNAKRIIQMGEDPRFVFPVGALGIDNIVNENLMSRVELKEELQLPNDKRIAAVTFHPLTSEDKKNAADETETVMSALLEADLYSVITMPNSDAGGDEIYSVILRFEKNYPGNFILHKSLGQKRYLSLLSIADIMVGNSSSGIIESASFKLPVINIGDRQKGREAPDNVIHCNCRKEELLAAINKGLSQDFRNQLESCINPYGDGNTAQRIVDILKQVDLHDISLIQKKFHDADEGNYCG